MSCDCLGWKYAGGDSRLRTCVHARLLLGPELEDKRLKHMKDCIRGQVRSFSFPSRRSIVCCPPGGFEEEKRRQKGAGRHGLTRRLSPHESNELTSFLSRPLFPRPPRLQLDRLLLLLLLPQAHQARSRSRNQDSDPRRPRFVSFSSPSSSHVSPLSLWLDRSLADSKGFEDDLYSLELMLGSERLISRCERSQN